jgi:hypothetical protein
LFLQKKLQKILVVKKNVVPLRPEFLSKLSALWWMIFCSDGLMCMAKKCCCYGKRHQRFVATIGPQSHKIFLVFAKKMQKNFGS